MTRARKKVIVSVIVIICAVAVFKAGMIAGAAGDAEPGSVGDPLITKSYLDAYIQNLGLSSETGTSEGYTKVVLSKGSTLVKTAWPNSSAKNGWRVLPNESRNIYSLSVFPSHTVFIKLSSKERIGLS